MTIYSSPLSNDFIKVLKHSKTYHINNDLNKLELFTCPINANKFDYSCLEEGLLESVADFSVSRRTKEKYAGKPLTLSKKAREKFKNYKENNGELGELLLYCFLEGHLNAPKILSKLELKTSTSMYVNGSDGVHFFKTPNGDYQLIFGESKLYSNLTNGFRDAFKSVHDFINEENQKGDQKSGIMYEKTVISSNIFKETLNEDEEKFIEKLLYPTNDNDFFVDDAFGIFVGFEIDVDENLKKMPNSEFRNEIDKQINDIVKMKIKNIETYISQFKLVGYNFYVYIMPFTDLDQSRKQILENLIK